MIVVSSLTYLKRVEMLLFCSFLVLAVAGSSPSVFTVSDNTTCNTFAFNASFLPDVVHRVPQYRICWRLTNGNTTIDMIVQARCSGYVAWGIGNQLGGGMAGDSDLYMGFFNSSGQMEAVDMFSQDTNTPPRDPIQNVLPGYTGYRTAGTTALRFQRLLNTGDAAKDRVVTAGVLEILVAYGLDDNTNVRHSDAALGYVDFFTGLGAAPGGATTSTQRVDPSQYQFRATLMVPFCKLWWSLINGNVSISVAMECQNDGWIAFGFSNQNSGGMTNADMTIGRVVGTAMQVQDYWTGSQGTPNLDVTQSITNTTGSRVNGFTSMWFTRRLDTGDSKDFRIRPGLIECIFAFHSTSDTLYYHNRQRGTVYIDFFSGIAPAPPVAATIDATWNASQYPNRFDAVRGVFEVYWAVDAARQNVDFAIRVLGFWASFGPARTSSGLMISSDPMMAYFDGNGAPVIEDQFAVSLSAPVADVNRGGQASFSALAGAANATGMTIKWRRALNTNDVATDNPISATGSTSFVLAWGSSAAPSYHGAQRAAVLIDVVGGGATVTASSDPLKIAHGSLMAIAFGLAMSVGIVIALVVPKDKTWWFPAHWILQAIATVLVFVAFAIILAWYSQSGNTHFRTNSVTMGSHAIIGIIVVVLVLWQAILGIVADRVWQSEHKKTGLYPDTKVFPDKVHWWLGRGVLVVGCINIFLGIAEMGYGWPFYVGWGVICAALVVLFVIAFIFYFKSQKQKGNFAVTMRDQMRGY